MWGNRKYYDRGGRFRARGYSRARERPPRGRGMFGRDRYYDNSYGSHFGNRFLGRGRDRYGSYSGSYGGSGYYDSYGQGMLPTSFWHRDRRHSDGYDPEGDGCQTATSSILSFLSGLAGKAKSGIYEKPTAKSSNVGYDSSKCVGGYETMGVILGDSPVGDS